MFLYDLIVDLVYIIPNFQYHFSMKHNLQTLIVHGNTSVTVTV